ncbi:MAG TPA: hypothetical protein VJV04_13885 [Nitrospiraceae bacterium]|nr:hypothetical protein [Nitrospiraceae bacterium]
MKQTAGTVSAVLMLVCFWSVGCQRDNPTENIATPTEKAAEAIERAIATPIEKAKAVEGTLQRAADRTAGQVEKAGE